MAQNVVRLHQTCQRAFGTSGALKFEVLEEDGPDSKQCILTITRPDGLTRSYKTEPKFSRKNDAKAQVATIAIEMDAINFITNGDSDALKPRSGILLAPLDVSASEVGNAAHPSSHPPGDDPSVRVIEECCVEWRAGRVKPHWVSYNDPKHIDKCGAALRIQLTAHALRVYSTDTIYATPAEAKVACATVALNQDVLEYIKYGNGQTQPSPEGPPPESTNDTPAAESPALSLQQFYETLPRPFPEIAGDITAAEINAPTWLNTTAQASRGGRLKLSFLWLSDGALGLHGCLLRLEQPGDCKSYLVDTHFPKRADAKAAVCLLAMSQGVGDHLRAIKDAAENRLPLDMKKFANEKVFLLLVSECGKVRPGSRPEFVFETDRDAFGCTLKVDLSPSAEKPDVREYTIEPEYRTKADAKAAVACRAVEQGVIELLRFRGESPPPGYVPIWNTRYDGSVSGQMKRKGYDGGNEDGAPDRKKRRKENGQGNVPAPPSDHYASGSSGLVPVGGSAHAGLATGQKRRGNRNVGGSTGYYRDVQPQAYPAHYQYAHSPHDARFGYAMHYHASVPEPFAGGTYPQSHPHPHGPNVGMHMYPAPGGVHPPYQSQFWAQPFSYGQEPPPQFPYSQQYPHPGAPAGYHERGSQAAYTAGPPAAPSVGVHPAHTHAVRGGGHTHASYNSPGNGSQGDPYPPSSDHSHKRNRALAERDSVYRDDHQVEQEGTHSSPAQPPPSDTKKKSGAPAKSHVSALLEYCVQHGIAQPKFHSSSADGDDGVTRHKVWMVVGTERLELPRTFSSLGEGRERVAKQVLGRLRRSQGAKSLETGT